MNRTHVHRIATFAVALLFMVSCRDGGPQAGATPAKRSTYERVLASGVIKAGYMPYPPGCIKDPNSGRLSGIHVEVLEKAAKAMGFRVEWVEASGWGSIVEDVKSGRVDMIGSPVWANSTRGRLTAFSHALFWSGICAYVRADDTRFDGRLASIDDPKVRIATIDGEMSDIVARSDYPHAARVSLPQNSDNSMILESVAAGRADVVFVEPYIAQLYLRNKPDVLKNITPSSPVRIFPNSMMVPIDDPAFLLMINTALDELANSGEIDRLLLKYVPDRGAFFPNARPYGVDGGR